MPSISGAGRQLQYLCLFFAFLLSLAHWSTAQRTEDDDIDFPSEPGFDDMRECAACPLRGTGVCSSDDDLADLVGCDTNTCLCREDILELAIKDLGDMVISLCSNSNDQKTATNFLSAYCSNKGYTMTGSPATASATGASVVTVTETVNAAASSTAVETIVSSAGSSLAPMGWKTFYVSTALAALLCPGVTLVIWRRLISGCSTRQPTD